MHLCVAVRRNRTESTTTEATTTRTSMSQRQQDAASINPHHHHYQSLEPATRETAPMYSRVTFTNKDSSDPSVALSTAAPTIDETDLIT
jgi:hypothetical protein